MKKTVYAQSEPTDMYLVAIVIYGLITTNTMQQAEDRAGGKLGNKGDEGAVTAIKMVDFKRKLQKL